MTRIVRSLACFAVCVCAAAVFAEKPTAVITGLNGKPAPKTGKPGDLLILDSSKSVGDRKKWIVWPELKGTAAQVSERLERYRSALRENGDTVIPAEAGQEISLSIEGNGMLVLASYPGTYRVALVVSNAEDITDERWTVTVTSDAPIPPDAPDPPDEPDPPPPPPPAVTFGLAPEVPKWLETVPEANRSQKSALRTALATVGNQAVAGQLTTIDSVKVASGTAIKNSGIDLTAWRTFGTSMNAAFDGLIATGKIANGSDYGKAMIEVAGGLAP